SALERLAGFQVELVAVRRQLHLLRAQVSELASNGGDTAGAAGEALRRCDAAAARPFRLSRMIPRRLGGGWGCCGTCVTRRCDAAADRLFRLSRMIHRRLGGGW